MKLFGKLNLKNVAVALAQVAGAYGGVMGGKLVELRIAKSKDTATLQLRGVGNQMDILSDCVLIEASAEGVFVFTWSQLESALNWPKSKSISELDWEIEPKEGKGDDSVHVLSVFRGRARLETETCDEVLPAVDELTPKTKMVVDSDKFSIGLKRASSMAGKQDVRHYLNGVFLKADLGSKADESSVVAVGTDGHRLARVNLKPLQVEGDSSSVIIPNAGVSQIEMFMNRFASGPIALGFCDSHVVMKGTNGYRLRCQLIDGQYPQYERVIPSLDSAKVVTFAKEDMDFGLGLARKSTGDGKNPIVELEFKRGLLSMKGFNRNGGSDSISKSESGFEIEGFDGTPFTTYLNITYVQDVLTNVTLPKVEMSVYNPSQAVVVMEGDCLYVVMPSKP